MSATTPDGRPIDPTLPEVVQRFLAAGARLETIRLDRNGQWWHEGGRVENPRVAALFNRSVDRTPGGTWVLRIPPFTYPIEVEDTPLFVEAVTFQGDGPEDPHEQVHLVLSDGTTEPLSPAALTWTEAHGFYTTVRDGRLEARFHRPPYYDLGERLVELPDGFALRLAAADRPLRPRL